MGRRLWLEVRWARREDGGEEHRGRTRRALEQRVAVAAQRVDHFLHHGQLAIVSFVREVDVVGVARHIQRVVRHDADADCPTHTRDRTRRGLSVKAPAASSRVWWLVWRKNVEKHTRASGQFE